jgi:hypothetical protein
MEGEKEEGKDREINKKERKATGGGGGRGMRDRWIERDECGEN